MFSESLRNSTMAVPAELGPTASPWSGGVTSPAAPAVGEFAAALIAEVMPSKPCSPVTLPLVNPVRAPAVAGWAAALGLRAAGGRPRRAARPPPVQGYRATGGANGGRGADRRVRHGCRRRHDGSG